MKHVRVSGPQCAVDASLRDDQVLRAERGLVGDVGFEDEPHAQRFAARLQDVEQALAADAAETVAAGGDRAALEVDVDVVPVAERGEDFAMRLASAVSRLPSVWSENTTPSRTCHRADCARRRDVVPRIGLLQQKCESNRPAGPPPMQRMRMDSVAGVAPRAAGAIRQPIGCDLNILDMK